MDPDDAWQRLCVLAQQQGGAFSHAQARACGLTAPQFRTLAVRHRLVHLQPRVWVTASTPRTPLLAEHAALLRLGPESGLSHLSAAAFHGAGPRPPVPSLSVPIGRRAPTDGSMRVFRTRQFEAIDVSDGRRVTSAARTIVDLGSVVDERELVATMLTLLQRRSCTAAGVLASLDRVGPTYSGSALVRKVVAQFDPSYESVLGVEAWRLLHKHLPGLVRGYELRYRGRLRICDLALPDLRLDIEADSWAWHGTRDQQNADKQRDRELAALGWLTLRLPSEDIRRRPAETVAQVLAIVRQRKA